jgi:uncharacterized protein
MPQRTDVFELGRLRLTSGEGRRLELHIAIAPFGYGGQRYAVEPALVPVRLDVSRTTGSGWALRLRFQAGLNGPCMRCLDPADARFEVDVREVSVPGGGEELESPYVSADDELDLEAWARAGAPARGRARPSLGEAVGDPLRVDRRPLAS